MSNALAIAAVTATLRNILFGALNNDPDMPPNPDVTVQPPDKAHEDQRTHFVNLFLYQVLPNAAWRNMDIPQRVKSGETAMPPLALNLYYMLTAYSQDDNVDPTATSTLSHRLLGRAMSALYDNAVLFPSDIAQALPNSELQNQVERVRITFQPLTVEEIFRLWSGFQSQYRISVAYEVSVVLIESTQPTKAPLPVLTRGKEDRGISSQASLNPPFTTLVTVRPPNNQTSIRLGEVLTINGFHLDVKTPQVLFTHTRLGITQQLPPEAGTTASKMTVKIPDNAPNDWPAGLYTVAIDFTSDDGASVSSNELPISLAPRIVKIDAPAVAKDTNGNITNVTIQLKCSPAVQRGQRVALLFGDREAPFVFPPAPPQPPTQDLTFNVQTLPNGKDFVQPGDYFLRLRVDGVDSLLVDRTVSPPKFDQSQKVTIS